MAAEAATPLLPPALWTAALQGRTEEVRQLLEGGADIEEPGGSTESSPLGEAALRGHISTVQLLLSRDADVSAKAKGGETPLLFAALHGHAEVALLLLGQGADIFAKNQVGNSSLHLALLFDGTAEVVLLLLDHGAEISAKRNDGQTPLHLAAYGGREELARLLVEEGAELSATDNLARTPEDIAHSRPRPRHLTLPRGMHPEEGVAAVAAGQAAVEVMLKAEVVRRAQCEAFAAGQHPRLGAESRVLEFDVGVARMILDCV